MRPFTLAYGINLDYFAMLVNAQTCSSDFCIIIKGMHLLLVLSSFKLRFDMHKIYVHPVTKPIVFFLSHNLCLVYDFEVGSG